MEKNHIYPPKGIFLGFQMDEIGVTQTETGKTNGKQCLDLSISFCILEKYTFDSILKYWYFIRYSSKLYQQHLKDIISRMKLEYFKQRPEKPMVSSILISVFLSVFLKNIPLTQF